MKQRRDKVQEIVTRLDILRVERAAMSVNWENRLVMFVIDNIV